MNTFRDKTPGNKNQSVSTNLPEQSARSKSAFQLQNNRSESFVQKKEGYLADNRPQSAIQKKQIEAMEGKSESTPIIQKKANTTGLPDQLKSGIENLSGHSMDDVKVHYNSAQPAQLNAHAYAQGTNIHIAPGQEKHLPHEAWHVVQQKQGRVKPTMQMNGKMNVNDDKGLEKEADVMGGKAFRIADKITSYDTKQLACEKCNEKEEKKRTAQLKPVIQMVTECEASDHANDHYHNLIVRLYEKKYGNAAGEYAVIDAANWRYVDLVDTVAKEVYEIKSNGAGAATKANEEAKYYKGLLNKKCGGGWKLGKKFDTIERSGSGEDITISTPKMGAIVYDVVERDLSSDED